MNIVEIRQALQQPFFDSSIVRHGFTRYNRDYDVVIAINESQFRYRFTHCPFANLATVVQDQIWRASWDDVFIRYSDWERGGAPEGFVWGVNYANAYPGARLVEESPLASEWSERFGKQMRHANIQTNTYSLDLVFYDLRVTELETTKEQRGSR
ncbi:MAG: hypothetical protein WA871_00005 [Candidatus Acidiferrales bacterium]